MTIASEIQRIKTNIANAYDVLEEKGATIPATKDVANLADCILTIPVGPEPSSKEYLVIPAFSYSNAPYIYSKDGLTWTQNTLSNSRSLMLATYAGNKYFLGSNESRSYSVLVTEDPSDSTSFVRANVEWIQEVAYGNNIYVGVSFGTRNVNISSDGINWTTHSNAIPRDIASPTSITFGNGVFVANFEQYDSGGIYYSTDGLTWTQSSTNITKSHGSIIFDGTQFVVYGLYNLQVSTDGINWTNKTKPAGYGSIAYCNGVYTTGRYQNYQDTYTSTDLTNWTTISNDYSFSQVFSDGKAFYKTFFYNGESTSRIQTSTDGINWTNITVPSGVWKQGC